MERLFTWCAGCIASYAGKPVTFVIAVLLILAWGVTGPLFHYSDTWQLVINTTTTIVTFLMVFLIQNSQNRDAAAMQAKLDELLRAVAKARADFVGIEHMTDAEIEKIRDTLEREAGAGKGGKAKAPHESVRQLQRRS